MSFSTLRASSGSEPSPCLFEPLSVITEAAPTSKSTASSPTEHDNIDFQRFQSVSPTLNVQSSTRIKNRIGLSHRKYETLRRELAVEGIKMPSPSTIRRNENRIFDDHFQNSDKPDFYGLVNKAVSKYDFSTFENVRITIGGDGGGDGEKSSVKLFVF
uniref:Uncharacterized protein n=1 Tax=Panagrolaimus superbus TaxID=310955 RepID=A0A914YW61_9BILA